MRTTAHTQLGIAVAAALTLALTLLATMGSPTSSGAYDLALAAIVAGLLACAQLFPVDGGAHGSTPLDVGVIFAAALLFDPGVAVLIVTAGVLLARGVELLSPSFRARKRYESRDDWAAFALVRIALQTTLAGLLLAAGGWTGGAATGDTPTTVVVVVLSAFAIWFVGTLASALSLSLGARLPVGRLWRQIASPQALLDSLPHFALGMVAALVAQTYLWALPLVLLPGIAWYRTIDERAQRRSADDFLESLADSVDAHDRHTVEHSQRVARYARAIAAELGLPRHEVDLVARAARVHDIGNITIERATLVRDDTLSGEEWRVVRRHPAIGSDLLLRFPQYAAAAPLLRHHHERMDGAGYPDGLYGEHIPIGARIIAVADALDAMASTRPYRPALPADVIRQELARQRGQQWDGEVIDSLSRLVDCGEIVLPGEERLRDYVTAESLAESASAAESKTAGWSQEPTDIAVIPADSRPGHTELEMLLMHQVFHDTLTGLPNRALFMDRLEHALTRIRRSSDAVAVIFVDLDNFKTINDTWGHQAGDRVLTEIARRMESCLRPGDTVARLAGDELTLLVENICEVEDAVTVAERVIAALDEPLDLNLGDVRVTASIGLAFSNAGQEPAVELLHNADVAMYRAKKDGKAGYAIFEPGMRNDAAEMVELKHDIAQAIERGELRVYYQPKALLDSGRIAGMEALVRWQHPERGLVLPAEFLPAAEHTGLVTEIDRLVLRDACRNAPVWRRAQSGGPPIVVSVNISARTFADPNLYANLAAILSESGLDPRALMLEITEDVAMAEPEEAITRFARLKELGVLLAIDNFGAGSSSLSYLKRFPIDTLKIARSFVDGLGYDPGDTAAVRAIIAFSSTLRRSVAAEGIETAEQFFQLRGLGCEQGQGNHLAPPLTREAASALVAKAIALPLGRVGRGDLPVTADAGVTPPSIAAVYTGRRVEVAS